MVDINNTNDEIMCGYMVSANRKKLWVKELRLLDILNSICEQLNIKYFLSFGSCIGAVRHNGFIPWDDDIDIGMLRKDFEILLEEGRELFPNDISIQFGISEHGFDNLMRIRDVNTTGITSRELNLKGCKGAFIEIYCFDDVNNNLLRRFQINALRIINKIILERTNGEQIDNKSLRFVSRILKKYNTEKLWRLYNSICQMQNNRNCTYVDTPIIPGYAKNDKHLFFKEDVIDTIKVPFEYTYAYIPKGYDRCLTTRYGNYMDLPPVESRGTHHECVVFYDPNKPYIEYEGSTEVKDFFNGDYSKSKL